MTQSFVLTGTTSWPVPDGWRNTGAFVEGLGAGGKGSVKSSNTVVGGGGGGGEYRKANLSGLTTGNSITVAIGNGTSATPGDTTFNATTLVAKAGGQGGTGAAGPGGTGGTGAAANANGGAGAKLASTIGSGGGGAGGPTGAGTTATTQAGGAANGGTVAGGTAGNPGNTSTTFDGSHGCGSGGSGGAAGNNVGFAGGNYGGGSGANGAGTGTSPAVAKGGDGLLCITYTANLQAITSTTTPTKTLTTNKGTGQAVTSSTTPTKALTLLKSLSVALTGYATTRGATNFTGAAGFFSRTLSAFPATSSVGTIFIRFRLGSNLTQSLIQDISVAGLIFTIADATKVFHLKLFNAAGTQLVDISWTYTTSILDGGYHTVICSWNQATPVRQLVLDDVLQTPSASANTTAAAYPATDTLEIPFATASMATDLERVYFTVDTYFDLSVTANKRLFINANLSPVYLGPDGSIPSGTAPQVYLSGTPDIFGANLGSAGSFAKSGSPTATDTALVATLVKQAGKLVNSSTSALATIAEVFTPGHVTTNQSIDATTSPIAALVRQTGKIISATTTPVVSLARSIATSISASTAALASLVRQAGKSVAASTAPVATLANQTGKGIAAETAPMASLGRQTAKAVTAATAPGATLIPSGAFAVTLSAASASIAGLAREIGKNLSAITSPVATLVASAISEAVARIFAARRGIANAVNPHSYSVKITSKRPD